MQNECSDRAQTDDHKELGDLVVAPSTPDISSAPDEHTKKERSFFDGAAPNQVFRLHLYFVSYGTDDKSHAASFDSFNNARPASASSVRNWRVC